MLNTDSIQTNLSTAVTLKVSGGGVPAYFAPVCAGGTVSV